MPTERRQLRLVTDPRLDQDSLLAVIAAAAPAGLDWVQVRAPSASARELVDLTAAVIERCHGHGVRVAVHDRLDVALAVGADAIQLGERSLPITLARPIAGRCQVGVSVHSLAGALSAAAAGADWLTFGTLFPSASHPGQPGQGLAALQGVSAAVAVPVIAIGGIDQARVAAVLATGAAGIAVISAITTAVDPALATATLRQLLDRSAPIDGSLSPPR